MSRIVLSYALLALLLFANYSTVQARAVSIEDVLSAGDVQIALVAIPENRASAVGGACWTTNDPFTLPPPVVTDFYPRDALGYVTGPIRVTKENPGPFSVSMHVENWAWVLNRETGELEYKHLVRADLDGDFEIYNEPGYDYTDWYLTTYMIIPGFLRFMKESHDVDWTTQVSGYVNYVGKGTLTVYPARPTVSKANQRALRAPARPRGSLVTAWAQLKRGH